LPHNVPSFVRPENAVFFITICCRPRGRNQLCFPDIATCLFESVAFRNQRGDWWVQFLLLMPDHLHVLASFPGDAQMPTVISEWKKFTARTWKIRWQRDFFDHRLRGEESVRAKEEYIRQNPVRDGFVDKPEGWPYVWWPTPPR
jgi:REP element-mobilizing transposase RayT